MKNNIVYLIILLFVVLMGFMVYNKNKQKVIKKLAQKHDKTKTVLKLTIMPTYDEKPLQKKLDNIYLEAISTKPKKNNITNKKEIEIEAGNYWIYIEKIHYHTVKRKIMIIQGMNDLKLNPLMLYTKRRVKLPSSLIRDLNLMPPENIKIPELDGLQKK